ncbi:MAG: bifunctional [glutamate--ammonia ligase]-adenylyl-L-tyrosine phosphorylase/[glutamate--ammonia-ligase] adenylyltransferase [Planctomycetia bacterium]|nr:bifunctional [glutamate--ammonia ligase]-adenylyl-L-tyrosine phosphorylase/[glutamate--ammonia-ligase] adenylyltransferase [Planctomycetia bacterium]
MQIEAIHRYLDHPTEAAGWFHSLGLHDAGRAHWNFVHMATAGVTLDLLADIAGQLEQHLPGLSDPDMALNNLDKFVCASLNPLSTVALFERDREALPTLLQMLSTSQHFSDLLIVDSAAYDLLRITEGMPVRRETLVEELAAEVTALAGDDEAVMLTLRRFKRRESLRIAYGDIVRGQTLESVTAQISHLADAIVEGAVRAARKKLVIKWGVPRTEYGAPARFVVLAMGKLGGVELNYSSDIDLIFLYDQAGKTDGDRAMTNQEFFDRLAREVMRSLTEMTGQGIAYRVDLRLRPEGERGPMVSSLESALHYYDILGRTWERQAYVKARAAAGDLGLGAEFLGRLDPWIYRRYLGLADIAGIKALKRRIEQRAIRERADLRNVKTGHGGIRDIEFAIQFLQLLNGGDLPELRTGNTLQAIARLEEVGCLTHQERMLLEDNYGFLRKIEHRLQIMFDLQTHLLPEAAHELRKLAIRMGYKDKPEQSALAAFEADYKTRTAVNRRILDHLLHDAFGDDAEAEPEVDLVLDPAPAPERIAQVLSKYGFKDVEPAYRNLNALATERIRFLSTRRCRHFLASISPALLRAIAATPDPDSTLVNLEKVSDSLGGKGVLWELFSFNPPTLKLYVELCASSSFLSGMLISNPGMIDELMDSLVLNKLPKLESLRRALAELTRAAEDLDPILHSFKSSQQLRVGVRDILGKDDIQTTTGVLSDIAQACLEQITEIEYAGLAAKYGEPTISEGPRAGERAELVIAALGKFGGRELNYHSDLDIVFLFEADGQTAHPKRSKRTDTTSNQHFFGELGQRIIKVANRLGPYGRLYEIDPRLRPTGKSGALATTFGEFARYYASGDGQFWERQALCRARVVYGEAKASRHAQQLIEAAAFEHEWNDSLVMSIRGMRKRLEEAAPAGNLKRGRGGIVDIEFLVQMLQLRHGSENIAVRTANTLDALRACTEQDILSSEDGSFFAESYRFLRTVEARLRLMHSTSRNDLPTDATELLKLARLVGCGDAEQLHARCQQMMDETRRRFDAIFDQAANR